MDVWQVFFGAEKKRMIGLLMLLVLVAIALPIAALAFEIVQ